VIHRSGNGMNEVTVVGNGLCLKWMMESVMANLSRITDENFQEEVMESNLPVLVDFGAEWCRPCKQLDPIVEELARDWQGQIKVLTLDIDSNIQTTMQMGVMSVPTLILFIDGKPVERIIGYLPKKRILEKIKPHLGL
jgi:thioredoxin 1